MSSVPGIFLFFVESVDESAVIAQMLAIGLDKGRRIWFNMGTMRRIDRLNAVMWWWPGGKTPAGMR